jgi:hypothetical protein
VGRKSMGHAPRKPGPMNEQERRIALNLKAMNPRLSAAAIAKVIGKRKATVAVLLHDARLTLSERLPFYVDMHAKAAAVAAAKGDAGPAQWVLENVSAQDENGTEVRVIDRPQVALASGLTVNVGLGLANIPSAPAALGPAPSLPIEVVDVTPKPDGSDT